MMDSPEIIMLKFDDVHGAQQALSGLYALEELDYAWVDDVAVVERHKSGRVSFKTPHGSAAVDAWWGSLLGMLLFLWFPPLWFIGGAVGGALVGAATGELLARSGLPKDLVERVQNQLTPGTSALLMIGIRGDVDEMEHAFAKYHPTTVVRESIPEETFADIREALAKDTD
ncbi:MAG TPA: DUF1269 domain-containing protein [Acidimicrobiales bacterium]|nr:DUF1269 domain-containing protein [Acidimicrobiales bacterium]